MNSTVSYCHIYGQLDQTRDRLPDELRHLLGLGLVCDTSIGYSQAIKDGVIIYFMAICTGFVIHK